MSEDDDAHELEEQEELELAIKGWNVFITILSVGVMCSFGTAIFIVLNRKLRASKTAQLVWHLCMDEGLFSLICLIQCGLNLNHRGFIGGLGACQFQSIYTIFFVISTFCSTAIISFNSVRQIFTGHSLSSLWMWLSHGLIYLIALIIAIPLSLVNNQAVADPSYTHCILTVSNLISSLGLYVILMICIASILTYNYVRIVRFVKAHDIRIRLTFQSSSSAEDVAFERRVRLMKRMSILVGSFVLCALPFFGICLYELITYQKASAAVYIFAISSVHFNAICNPLLYFWAHSETRKMILEKCPCCIRFNRIYPNHSSLTTNMSAVPPTGPTSQISTNLSSIPIIKHVI
jgi:hypothetical protein